MKKVLILIHTLLPGGAEKVLLNLVKKLDKDKYDITVMMIVNDGVYIDEMKKIKNVKVKYIFNAYFKKQRKENGYKNKGIHSFIMNTIWKGYNLYLKKRDNKKIYSKKIKESYDIEIAFLEGKSAKIISNSPNENSKKIVWIHTDIVNFKKSSQAFKNKQEEVKCYNKFDEIICVSEGVKEKFEDYTKINDKTKVIHNIIDIDEINIKSLELVDDVEPVSGFLFCTVGRLIPEKGYDRLLRVCKRLKDEGNDITLWIIGEGYERVRLQQYINENNLNSYIKLIGYRNNVYKYIKKADAFVCSSRIEGLSTVINEAVILEKPIVTTLCPGVDEILGQEDLYACVTKNNEESLLEGMKKILKDKVAYERYEENIKKKKELFSELEIIKKIEEIF